MNKLKLREELKPYLYLGATLCLVILFYKVLGNFAILVDLLKEAIRFIIGLLKPAFVAFVIFYFLRRPVVFLDKVFLRASFFKRHVRLSRVLSIFIVYSILLSLVFTLFSFILPQIWESIKILILKIPEYMERLEEFSEKNQLKEYMSLFLENEKVTRSAGSLTKPQGIDDFISSIVSKRSLDIRDAIAVFIDWLVAIGGRVVNLGFGIFLSIYLLLDAEAIGRQISSVIKSIVAKNVYYKWSKTLDLMDETLYRFLIGKIYCSIFVMGFDFIGLTLLKVPHGALISLIVGVMNIIPYIGPFLGGAVGALITLLHAPNKVIWIILLFILAQELEENLIEPKVLGEQIGLKPFWIMFSVIIGGELFGIWGVFLAVPTFAVLKVFIVQWITQKNA